MTASGGQLCRHRVSVVWSVSGRLFKPNGRRIVATVVSAGGGVGSTAPRGERTGDERPSSWAMPNLVSTSAVSTARGISVFIVYQCPLHAQETSVPALLNSREVS